MIKVKHGASIDGCRSEILRAAISCAPIFEKFGVDLVVTSGSESYKHTAKRSAHYRGDAMDWRIRNVGKNKSLASVMRPKLINRIKRKLGHDYVVIHEGSGRIWEHIHVHYSPIYIDD